MVETNQGKTIVGDSGPLIALAIIDQLELLRKLYGRVVIPRSVWEEVTEKGAGMPGSKEVSQLEWLKIEAVHGMILKALNLLVDKGEAEAIALAMKMENAIVLLDDAQARRVAKRFQVERIGTLGVLRLAKKAGLLPALRPLVEKLQSNGIYLRKALVEAVLSDVGETG